MQAFHSMMQDASPPTVIPQMLLDLLVMEHPDWTSVSWRSKLHSFAPSTAKVYDAGKKAYLKFCARFNFTPIPAQKEVLILFVTELSQTLVYNSVRTYLAGVRHFLVVNSAGNPLQDKLRLQLALVGIRRWKPKAGGTRLPITLLVLRAIKKVLDAAATDYQNILLWACCVRFFGFMRSGEFTLISATAFNPTCHLSI